MSSTDQAGDLSSHPSVATAFDHAMAIAPSDPAEALRILDQLATPSLRRTDPAAAARSSYLRARLLSERGRYDEALAEIRNARRDWLVAGMELEALRTDIGAATVLIELGEHEHAVDVSERLLARLEENQAGDPALRRTIRAGAHGNIGNAHNLMGNHRTSLRNYDVASNLYAALGQTGMQAQMDANGAIALVRLGMAHRALTQLESARRTLLDADQELPAAKCLLDLADANLLLGRSFTANRILMEAAVELERLQAVPELARLQLLRAHIVAEMGLRSDAHDQADQAAASFQELNMLAEAADAARLSGQMSLELGSSDLAEAELAKAERMSSAAADKSGQARAWLLQGRLVAKAGRHRDAHALATRALTTFEAAEHGADAALAHLDLVRHVEDPETALRHLSAANAIIDRLDLPALRLHRDMAAADLQADRGEVADAARTLERAISAHRAEAAEAGGVELYLRPQTRSSQVVDQLIRLLVAEGTQAASARAWQVATMANGSLLAHLSQHPPAYRAAAVVRGPGGSSPEPWWTELSSLYDERGRAYDEEEREALTDRIRHLHHRIIRHYLTELAPRASGDQPLPRVPEAAALQYHVSGEDVIAFVLRDGYVDARVIPGAVQTSADLVRQWRSECRRMSSAGPEEASAADLATSSQLLAGLSELLVWPIRELLTDLDDETLHVVAHRHLHGVPFEALPLDGAPMADSLDLVFSVGHVGTAETETGGSPPRVTVFAVPDATAPEIADEAADIGRHAPAAALNVGADATADALRTTGPDIDLLHVACHGEHDVDDPMFARVRLADRWLTAAEVTGLDLTGTDVVLSSCDLGRASDVHTEALGFTWSLFVAGCHAVVACNWAVDDAATALFMRSLHQHLGGGVPLRTAVELARKSVRDELPHPYYWGPFRYFRTHSTHPE